jgi:hypothetical protein
MKLQTPPTNLMDQALRLEAAAGTLRRDAGALDEMGGTINRVRANECRAEAEPLLARAVELRTEYARRMAAFYGTGK